MYQYILTGAVLGISSFTDWKWRKVCKSVMIGYLILAVAGYAAEYAAGGEAFRTELAKRLVPGIFFLGVSWVSRQSLGYGDSLLLAVCGISVGFQMCIWTAVTAFFWAGIWALILYRFRGKDRRREFPFVPFLFLGFVLQWAGGL